MTADAPPSTTASVLGQAAFLACSWTWCIGMWLPVYLIHDFGAAGWIAFAIPNVVGAAAVGFVHRAPGAAARFRARGLTPMRWFSAWTVLFHVAFLAWLFASDVTRPVFVPAPAALLVPLLALGAGLALSGLGSRSWRTIALALVPVAPLLILAALRFSGAGSVETPESTGVVTTPWALTFYTVGLAFGFLLCPHLDLTFMRVREETPSPAGEAAFALGFGAFFLMMIVITAGYAAAYLLGVMSSYVYLHILLQATFTIGVHLRELRDHGWPLGRTGAWGFWIAAVALAASGSVVAGAPDVLGHASTRFAYEIFLFAYALPFPAAAWFLLTPPRRERLGAAFWLAVVAGTPTVAAAAWFGEYWAVPLGVAIPLVVGALAPAAPARAG